MDSAAIHFASTDNGSRVAYARRGSGQLVVLPPMTPWTLVPPRAVPEGTDIWELARGAELLAYDHVGTGMSQRTGYDFTLDATVDELHAVVEATDAQDFVLLAVLYAGPIAIKYAVKHPERVKHLVLRTAWADSREAAQRRLMMFGAALEQGDWYAASQAYARLGWNRSGEEADAVAEGIRSAVEPEVLLAYFKEVAEHDARPLLRDVTVPTTVMRRPHHVSPLQIHERPERDELVQQIPGAELRIFEGPQWAWQTYSFIADDSATESGSKSRTPTAEGGTASDADLVRDTGLSTRELEVLRLVAAGSSNRDIAERLVIAESTVANHVRSILAKTDTANRTEAGSWAARHGLLED